MECYHCGAKLTEHDFCTNCGADVKQYKQVMYAANAYYNDGLEKAHVRDLSGAVISLRQCLQLNKMHVEARNLLGLVYFEMGETEAALEEWILSKNIRPEKNIADDYLNDIQSSASQLDTYTQAIRKYNLSLAYCQQDSQDMAIIQLKKVVSMNPKYVQARLLLSLLYINSGAWEKAKKELLKCLKVDKNNTMALRYLKEVEKALEKEDDKGGFRKPKDDIIKYQSGNETIIQPIAALEQKKNIGWLWYLMIGLSVGLAAAWFLILPARVQTAKSDLQQQVTTIGEQLGKKDADLAEANQQIQTLTDENSNLESQLELYKGSGAAGSITDSLAEAAYLYMENPDDIEGISQALDGIDRTAVEGEEISESIKTLYDKLLEEVGPTLTASYYDQGYEAYQQSNYEDAITALEKSVSYDDQNAEALFILGNAYRENGDNDKAVETYQQLIDNFPGTDRASRAETYISEIEGAGN